MLVKMYKKEWHFLQAKKLPQKNKPTCKGSLVHMKSDAYGGTAIYLFAFHIRVCSYGEVLISHSRLHAENLQWNTVAAK